MYGFYVCLISHAMTDKPITKPHEPLAKLCNELAKGSLQRTVQPSKGRRIYSEVPLLMYVAEETLRIESAPKFMLKLTGNVLACYTEERQNKIGLQPHGE